MNHKRTHINTDKETNAGKPTYMDGWSWALPGVEENNVLKTVSEDGQDTPMTILAIFTAHPQLDVRNLPQMWK